MASPRWFTGLKDRSSRRARRLQFEALDARDLLAVLNVGVGQTYTSIQTAVNNARAGDVIQLAATGTGAPYSGSIDLSLMGSAVGTGPGALTIRGANPITNVDTTTAIRSPGGPVFQNAQAFAGDLVIEQLTLSAPTATAGREAGILLNNYSGSLTVRDVIVFDTVDVGIEITNSSGAVLFDEVEVSAVDVATPVGIRMVNYAAAGNIKSTKLINMTDASMVIDLSGTTQMNVMLLNLEAFRSGGSLFTANDGVRVTASNTARLDLTVASAKFDDLAANSFEITTSDTASVNANVHSSYFNLSEGAGRNLAEPTVRFRAQSASNMAVFFDNNFFQYVTGDNLTVQALGSSVINATITNNYMLNSGTAADHEVISIIGDSTNSLSTTSTINAYVYNNFIYSPYGNGIYVLASGNSTFNVIIEGNDVEYTTGPTVNSPPEFGPDVSAVVLETMANSAARLNARFTGSNALATPVSLSGQSAKSLRVTRQPNGTAIITIEGDGSVGNLGAYLQTVNSMKAPSISAPTGTLSVASIGSLLSARPLVLGDLVWDDTNKNGRFDGSEAGFDGTMLTLTGTETVGGATVTRNTWTDGEGGYFFGGLKPGTYTVTLTPRAGMDLTLWNIGPGEVLDSDFRPIFRTATVTLTSGLDNFNLDAGLVPTDGKLWKNQARAEDIDGDGQVTPLDALLIIIDLNTFGPRNLAAPTLERAPQPFIDVDGSNSVSPYDALLVINYLNARGGTQGESPEPLLAASTESVVSGSSESSSNSAEMYLPLDYYSTTDTSKKSSATTQASALDAFFAELAD